MNNKFIIGMFMLILLIIAGCTNNELDTLHEEKELLTNEILNLKKLIADKDEEINFLGNKIAELSEPNSFSLEEYNHSFDNLQEIYKIDSKYLIKDEWYVINEDYFYLELLEFENAKKVNFNVVRLESDQPVNLVFTDTDSTDGWVYTTDHISKIIDKHKMLSGSGTYEPYFIIYTEVTLQDGNVIKTPNLPIYNK